MGTMLLGVLVLGSTLLMPRLDAQLAAAGPSGVAMGHLHFTTRDMEASRKFWTTLGGVPVQNGALQLIQFPGVFVMLRQAEPTGGTAGTVVDRVTFRVRNIKESMQTWRDAAITVESGGVVNAPDGVIVELMGDPALTTPIAFDRIALRTVAPAETQAWYVKTFGASAAKRQLPPTEPRGPRVELDSVKLPGVALTFAKSDAAPATTKGRALDHIGFEVKGLEAFCKKLEADGTKLTIAYRQIPNSAIAIAFLYDPWGTYIELTENLAPAK